nr:probable E3 ubiquitin-protein ligase RHA4A [Tanacetum cinerariifolium]
MGYLTSSSTNGVSSHLYSQALQMKLYQAFIFSIPILFSVILFLLFYLFYLKRTFSNSNSSSSSSIIHPRNSRNQDSSTLPQCNETGSKINLEDKLIVILFDEDLYSEDSMCCVCLGEFEINEKLHQIPACQHMFHGDCIRNWLYSNITCPLCRCSVVNTDKSGQHEPPVIPEPDTVINVSLDSQRVPLEHSAVIFEGSSSSSMDNKLSRPNQESVIQIHDS